MSAVLVLAGGPDHAHDFGALGRAVSAVVESAGHQTAVVEHPDVAAALVHGYDALVVAALHWRMEGDAYAPWRERWSYSAPPATRAALSGFVAGGGGLLALHTAAICFDDWPEWGDVVGASWRWGTSWHPPLGPVSAEVVAEHPVVRGLPARLELVDEVYGDLDVRAGVEVLAVAHRSPEDAAQPVVFVHRHGAGRVVYDGFGHDTSSITDRHHASLLRQALAWILEAD